jgi:single-stranded-DNA-specific exonuclease
MLNRRWSVKPAAPSSFLARFSEFPSLVAQVFYNSGITTPEDAFRFLGASDRGDGSPFPSSRIGDDPFLMNGMMEAVERIRRAMCEGEAIAVYGDFDADGVCATALLTEALKKLGARAMPYIPHRVNEGYGLNEDALRDLKDKGARVVVTVDCGIRSLKEVDEGMALGLDMIVTDHHSVGPELPRGVAVINPKQPGDVYPFQEFAGVGIAFKLAQALCIAQAEHPLPNGSLFDLTELLDLVALGTVADLVPLIGENRVLVRLGLARLNKTERPGLQAMMQQVAGKNRSMNAGTIGYYLGPRLNAAGRIEHARTAYRLLTTQYPGEAEDLAQKLEATNRDRQKMTEEMTQKARAMVAELPRNEFILVAGSPEFPEGIIGLIASKIQEDAYRPAIAMTHQLDKGKMRGSARSIPEFSMIAALDECADLLERHGGHAAAAGFTVSMENYPALHTRLRRIAERELKEMELLPTLSIDAEASLSDMNWRLLEQLDRLAPFGYGNREPVFVSRNVLVKVARQVGTEHVALTVSDGIVVWDAIAFRQKDILPQLNPTPKQVDIVYNLTSKVWQDEPRLQLEVKDIRLSEG